MDNSSEITSTDGTDYLDEFFYKSLEGLVFFGLNVIVLLLGFPFNSYVIWLIVRGAGNGLAAEFFSLNLSVCEIVCLECVFLSFFAKSEIILIVVNFLDGLTFTGRAQFLCLICVERYLAVLHPVTFLKYKPLRYRVICCVIVWVVSAIFGGLKTVNWIFTNVNVGYILILAQLFIFLSIQLFCLVAVLRALKQSGPGERKREENLMKRRAFYIILITTMTMLISVVFYMIVSILFEYVITLAYLYYVGVDCIIMAGWVQPLFFFYRLGKLPFIRR